MWQGNDWLQQGGVESARFCKERTRSLHCRLACKHQRLSLKHLSEELSCFSSTDSDHALSSLPGRLQEKLQTRAFGVQVPEAFYWRLCHKLLSRESSIQVSVRRLRWQGLAAFLVHYESDLKMDVSLTAGTSGMSHPTRADHSRFLVSGLMVCSVWVVFSLLFFISQSPARHPDLRYSHNLASLSNVWCALFSWDLLRCSR